MKILETLDLYIDGLVKTKALKKFKEEFPVKLIDVTELLDMSFNKFKLSQTTDKANEEYQKIESKIREDILNKLFKKIKEVVK